MLFYSSKKNYAKCFTEKCLNLSASPSSLYINKHLTLPSLCGAPHKDGWGEHFEQWDVGIGGDKELYVHLWQDEDWSIMTEQDRFAPHFAEGLPELCFSILRNTGALICIKRGESGYYPSDWDTGDPAQNRELADYNNQELGVTDAQRKAMEAGSMFGWSCPAADPRNYPEEQQGPQMGGMRFS